MPVSADQERRLIDRYKLPSLYPDTWPHAEDDSSSEEEEKALNGAGPMRHASKLSIDSRSRYRNINRHASIRSGNTNSESLVQKDEPDALGMASSVVAELKKKGVPPEETRRFMLGSTSFSPQMFLSHVHQDASTEDLLRGLEYLSQSIEQKSASLKVLVETNFEKFVKAKATIDNVYTGMRTQGAEPEAPRQSGSSPNHARQASRNQTHFRNASGAFNTTKKPVTNDKKKNALTKESEYGVQGIRAPLLEVAIRAEEVWGPALGGREREETLRSAVFAFDVHNDILQLSSNLRESIRKNDYDNIVQTWRSAKKDADTARNIADLSKARGGQLSDDDAQKIILTAKMWHDVTEQINGLKIDVWKRLRSTHGRKASIGTEEADKEEHMQLIGVLIQLGVDDNPIWQWLHSRYLYLRNKIARSFERSRIEIEIARRRLANSDSTNAQVLAKHLRSVAVASSNVSNSRAPKMEMDTAAIIALWEKVEGSMNALLSIQNGILGEVIEYWDTAQSFIDNKAQRAFSNTVIAAGQDHLELEPDDVQNLRSGSIELINLVRDTVLSFFSDPPVEDLSELYSPIPTTPATPATSNGQALTLNAKKSFDVDLSSAPPPSLKRGDAWEKFAFWPPQANSLSGSHYLSRILVLVGIGASEMASLSVTKQGRTAENLKSLVGVVRERCVQAMCAAWDTDAERCKVLEMWKRHADRKDLTTMPASFAAFEERVLQNMQKIAYISDAMNARGSADVVVPPPTKLLQALRGAFVTSLYKAFSGMVDNAERSKKGELDEADPDGVTLAKRGAAESDTVNVAVDPSNRNVRLLLTLSNLSHLRAEVIPQLISQFETNFSVKLTDESKTIRDVLSQIDARLFESYVRPTVQTLTQTITDGITSPEWVPTTNKPTDARPYVYTVLLKLVLTHSEITSSAPPLTTQILSYLLEQASQSLIDAFKQRQKYTLPALMQATLDVEFMAQTLNNYTTDRVNEVQSQIYIALDERTDNDARAKLQGELPEMRAVLKKLREGTKGEFGCFKKERRGRAERANSTRG